MKKVTINDLKKVGFNITEIDTLRKIDDDLSIIKSADKRGAKILLSLPSATCDWLFSNVENMLKYFSEGKQVSISGRSGKFIV